MMKYVSTNETFFFIIYIINNKKWAFQKQILQNFLSLNVSNVKKSHII